MVTPTVAQAEGTATTLIPGEEPAVVVYSAILVKHGEEYLLFDTGLGERIAAQYEQDMPRLQRLLFKVPEPSISAKSQLAAADLLVKEMTARESSGETPMAPAVDTTDS